MNPQQRIREGRHSACRARTHYEQGQSCFCHIHEQKLKLAPIKACRELGLRPRLRVGLGLGLGLGLWARVRARVSARVTVRIRVWDRG